MMIKRRVVTVKWLTKLMNINNDEINLQPSPVTRNSVSLFFLPPSEYLDPNER